MYFVDISAPLFALNHLPSHHDFLNPTASSAIDSTGITDDNESIVSDSEHDHPSYGAPTRGKRRHCSHDGAVDFYFPLGEGEEEEEEEEEEEGGVFGHYGDETPEWNDYAGLPTEAFGQRHEIQDR